VNHRACLAAFAALSLATSATAYADVKPAATDSADRGSDNRAVAEMLFFTARGLMEAGRYSEACSKLAESYRLDAAAGTLLNLAVCHEKEGKIASAWGEFRQAISDARRVGRADREELAKEHVSAIEGDLPMLAIEVPAHVRVAGLEITRNGVPLQGAAWATELPIDPGNVEIIARAPGYKARTKTLAIAKRQRLTVSLEPLEIAPVPLAPVDFWTGRRKLGLALAGVGVASAATGAYFGLTALSDRSKSDAACPVYDGDRRCTSAGVDLMTQAKTSAWVADAALGVSALSFAAGAYFFFTGASQREGARAMSTPATKGAAQNDSSPWTLRVNAGPAGAQGIVTRTF
jgi:hypothetical protein